MNFGVNWEAEHRRVLLDGNAALERSAQSVARSQAVAAESEQIGTEVISELGGQRERLLRAKRRLSQTDEELNKTRKILNIMRLKVLTNKIVLIFIILLEIAILAMLGLFYMCFFTVLGSLFALQLWLSISYASKLEKPFFLYSGLVPRSYFSHHIPLFRNLDFGSPGISFKPNIILSTAFPTIQVDNSSAKTNSMRYVEALMDFLQEYNKSRDDYKTVAECEYGTSVAKPNVKPCFFDIQSLGVCGKPPYGYTNPLQPCVLIKFNKRFDWVPIYYNRSSHLPEKMPLTLQNAVRSSNKHQVWMWCDGANSVDKKHIGEIEYFPSPGFSVRYFPFIGQPNYLSPLVALRFRNITLNKLVTVACNLWAFNIDDNKQNSLSFQIILSKTRK